MEVTFFFEDGHKETIELENFWDTEYRMCGVAANQNGSKDPQEWMDDYNDWSEDEGRPKGGDCVFYISDEMTDFCKNGYIVTSEDGSEFLSDKDFNTFIYLGYNRESFDLLEGEVKKMKIPDEVGGMTTKTVCILKNTDCLSPVVESELKYDGGVICAVRNY